jgi:hypothetical protein
VQNLINNKEFSILKSIMCSLMDYELLIYNLPLQLHVFFMFCWPYIVIYPYNDNQEDTLIIFNLFLQLTATRFEQDYCSSSGGTTLYIPTVVYTE